MLGPEEMKERDNSSSLCLFMQCYGCGQVELPTAAPPLWHHFLSECPGSLWCSTEHAQTDPQQTNEWRHPPPCIGAPVRPICRARLHQGPPVRIPANLVPIVGRRCGQTLDKSAPTNGIRAASSGEGTLLVWGRPPCGVLFSRRCYSCSEKTEMKTQSWLMMLFNHAQ